jgi:LysM repeat protein
MAARKKAEPEVVTETVVEPPSEETSPAPVKKTAAKAPKKSTTVKEGETVDDVAGRLGITVEKLREVNGLRHDNLSHGVVLKGG